MKNNKTHFSLCVFDCDFQDALSILRPISLNMHETKSSFILNFLSKFDGKGGTFMVGPGRHLASVHHSVA